MVKNLPTNAGDSGGILGSGRSPRGGNSNPLQYSCLENPMGRGAWRATVHGVAKSRKLFLSTTTGSEIIGEGNGNPLHYSCLENTRDDGAWWAAIYGVAQSQMWLKRLSSRLDLLAIQGTLKSLQQHSSKASILQHSALFRVQLTHPYMTTGKTIDLTRQTFVGKIMCLLFNMLSRLVIASLLRSKHL